MYRVWGNPNSRVKLGGNLGNFLISFMIPIEVPIHKYFSEPQNYNPVKDGIPQGLL